MQSALDLKLRKKLQKDEKGSEGRAGDPPLLPPGLRDSSPRTVEEVRADEKTTRPKKRFTEATLLTAMETAGRTLEEKELSNAHSSTLHFADQRPSDSAITCGVII